MGACAWLFNSDVCKHCTAAPCQEACPTGALIRNEFDDVYVQADICNGCGYCVVACPFGVLGRSKADGAVHKCTLCYDRQKDGIEPACAKSCPTDSIQFGPVSQLRERANRRVAELHARGQEQAYLYGSEDAGEYKRLNAFFLLTDEPAAYNLPPAPRRPSSAHAAALPVERRGRHWPERRQRLGARPRREGRLMAWRDLPVRTAREGQRAEAEAGAEQDGQRGAAVVHTRDAYRDVPILAQPTWGREIAAYFFLGGVSAGATVLGSMAAITGHARYVQLTRTAHYVAFATLLPCPVFLIADLGKPSRFHHMLRIFKPSSPMNLGAWTLTVHGGMATLTVARMLAAEGKLPVAGGLVRLMPERLLAAGAVPSALALGGYTGVLLGTTSVPVWFKSPLLGALFMASSFSTGIAAVSLVAEVTRRRDSADTRALSLLARITGATELMLLGGYLVTTGTASKPLLRGKTGQLMRAAVAALGSGLALEVGIARKPNATLRHRSATALALAGGALLRWAVVQAGKVSASDRDETLAVMAPSRTAPGWGPTQPETSKRGLW